MKKILFPLFSLFLAYRSVELVFLLNGSQPRSFSLLQQFLLAGVLNLFITGVFAFTGFVYATHKLLPAAYYRIKSPEKLTRFYRFSGGPAFKYLLLLLFWGSKKNKKRYFDGTPSGLQNLDYQTKQSEFGHAGALLVVILVSINMLLRGHFILALLTSLLNILFNLYPVILQRVHRIQLERVMQLKKETGIVYP